MKGSQYCFDAIPHVCALSACCLLNTFFQPIFFKKKKRKKNQLARAAMAADRSPKTKGAEHYRGWDWRTMHHHAWSQPACPSVDSGTTGKRDCLGLRAWALGTSLAKMPEWRRWSKGGGASGESSRCTGLWKGTGQVPPPPPRGGTVSSPPLPPPFGQGAGCVLCMCRVVMAALHAWCIALVCFFQAIWPLYGSGISSRLPEPGAVGLVLPIDGQQHPGMACTGAWEGQIEE